MTGAVQAPAAAPATTSTVEIEYFTDPLCSWSWAFEPQWRRLRFEYGDQLRWRYRMGGMIADWASYSDPLNSVSRPVQMAPQWIEVHHLSGMPIEAGLWMADPPHSSYPACLAVKAAELQSAALAEKYLRRLREAALTERQNIGRREVLVRLAAEVPASAASGWDLARFVADLDGEAAREAFREDLKLARYRGIGRFPTLVIRRADGERGVLIVGYRTYPQLCAAVAHVAPELKPLRRADDPALYERFWGGVVARELAELLPGPAGDRHTASSPPTSAPRAAPTSAPVNVAPPRPTAANCPGSAIGGQPSATA